MYTIAATLDHLAPRIPGGLVSPDALARVAAVAGRLPAALSSWLYLECRLRGDDPRVDLVLHVDERAREMLLEPGALDPALMRHPAWRRVRELARAWADPSSPLHRGATGLWLEFDVAADAAAAGGDDAMIPGVFVDFARAAVAAPATVDDRLALVVASARPLLGGAASAGLVARLRHCLAVLPESGTRLMYAGVMLSRGASEVVRLCVTGLDRPSLAAYLRDIGWPGDAGEVERLGAELGAARVVAGAPARAPDIVHVDVSAGGVLPRLGLEHTLARREQLAGRLPEPALLERLVERGLCAPGKRAALAEWPGHTVETMRHELWPSLVTRRVNHIKVVHDAGRPAEAKGYLRLRHEYHGAVRRPRSTE